MTTNISSPPVSGGWAQLLRGRNGVFSLALAGGVTLHAINIYTVTTVMPSVVAEIGGLDYYAWSTTLFVVASILGSALSVRLLRKTGARGAYAAAAIVFGIGTTVCSFAPSMPILLSGRVVQGLGGRVPLRARLLRHQGGLRTASVVSRDRIDLRHVGTSAG
jgi:MFS family permease